MEGIGTITKGIGGKEMIEQRPPYPKAYAIDFDDTITQTHFSDGRWLMGELVPDMKEAINAVAKENEIIIFTARPKKEWKEVTRYLAENGVIFDRIAEKPLAIYYIDDRALRPNEFIKQVKQENSIHEEEVKFMREHYLDELYASDRDPEPLRIDEFGNPF